MWDGSNSSAPMKTIPIDRESRKYVHIRLNNKISKLDENTNELVSTEIHYDLEKC